MAFDAPQADRRQFLTWSAGGAFMLALAPAASQGQPPRAPPGPQSPWFKINPDGRVTVLSNAVEMGQGSHTGHAAIIADELDVPWSMVDVQMVDLQTYANNILTGGSRSISQGFAAARLAGATARTQMMQAAAQRWNVAADAVETANGKVINKATRAELGYGELADAAGQIPTPTQVAYKATDARACIGVVQPTKRLKERVTGTETYGLDVRVPGMMRAAVKQTPVFGATLVSVDPAPAMAVPGVKKVVSLPNAVAVIAQDTWTAFKAADLLKPVWSAPPQTTNTAELEAQLVAACAAAVAATPVAPAADAAAGPKTTYENVVKLRAAYEAAPKKVEQTYGLTHVNHVTMEPQNAVVHVKPDQIEIWTGTQVPSQVRSGAARWAMAGAGAAPAPVPGETLKPVVLHTTMLGGGFGRRLATDYVEMAVRIAAQWDGPVQMVWTREEDFTHDPFRRMVRQTYRAGLNADGLIDGYECVSAASDSNVAGGFLPEPYETIKTFAATQAGTNGVIRAGIPQGFWRSVNEGISIWGRESFIDECAHAAGQDPYQYRAKLLGENTRARRLLDSVAQEIDWTKRRPAGTGVGIAIGTGFGSIFAHAIEVEVKDKTVKVTRMVVAGDLGTTVAPSQVRNQFQGGGLMALGTALTEAQTFTGGKADMTQFGEYKVIRQRQSPEVEVHLFESPQANVGGAGEPPVPTVAPALANAIFAATGERVRTLPIERQGWKV